MPRYELVGVASTIKDSDIRGLTSAEQDLVIAEEASRLTDLLKRFVGGAQPVRGAELVYQVRGPFTDPLQGVIHTHVLAARFDLDALPKDSDAYRVHVLEADGVTTGNRLEGGELHG